MRPRAVLEPAAAAVVAFLAVVLVWHFAQPAASAGPGDRAPDFAGESLQGPRTVRLSAYAGRLIVLHFWASWCGPCAQEAPGLERAARRWQKGVVTVVAVDVRDAKGDARAWIRKYHVSYVVAHDGSDTAANLYGVDALPVTFLISPRGRVVDRLTGFVQENELNRRIAQALERAGGS